MARLYLDPGSQTYGPIPGGEVSRAFGSNEAETVTLAADANVIFDPSFVRGNDTLIILADFDDYDTQIGVAGVTLTNEAGASIFLPAFGNSGGIAFEFEDATARLFTTDNGLTYTLDSEMLTQDPGSDPDPSEPGSGAVSLDVGSPTVPKTLDASAGDMRFTDDASVLTNVVVTGFGTGDTILVSNATSQDYNFQRDFDAPADLVMSYTDADTGATNAVVIAGLLDSNTPVFDFDTAVAAAGFAFLAFA